MYSKKLKNSSLLDEVNRHLISLINQYSSNDNCAFICLGWTILYFFTALVYLHFYPGYLSTLLMSTSIVRTFVVFHDACHLSFFKCPTRNKWLSNVLSIFLPQSPSDWTKSHNLHHAHIGDSSIFDYSLTIWFSEEEYNRMNIIIKLLYRIVRDPLLFPIIISFWGFIIFPFIKSPLETIKVRSFLYFVLYYLFNHKTLFLYILSTWIAGSIGVILFHLQHQCNSPYRVPHECHSTIDAGIQGSTYLIVPWPLKLMTLGIEYHHIHHVSTRVPCYELELCHRQGELYFGKDWEKLSVNKVNFKKAFLSLFHSLYDGPKVKFQKDIILKFKSFEPYQSLGLHD